MWAIWHCSICNRIPRFMSLIKVNHGRYGHEAGAAATDRYCSGVIARGYIKTKPQCKQSVRITWRTSDRMACSEIDIRKGPDKGSFPWSLIFKVDPEQELKQRYKFGTQLRSIITEQVTAQTVAKSPGKNKSVLCSLSSIVRVTSPIVGNKGKQTRCWPLRGETSVSQRQTRPRLLWAVT